MTPSCVPLNRQQGKAKNIVTRQRITLTALFLFLTAGVGSCYASPAVSVDIAENNKTLHYSGPIRLSNVLNDTLGLLPYQPYTLGASLVDKKKQQTVDKAKKDIIDQLLEHQTFSTAKLLSQLKNSDFAPREKISLDNDIVRVFPKKNPLLNSSYTLYLPKRPDKVWVYGAIQTTQALPLTLANVSSLQHYLPSIPFYNVAMNTDIWVIQPDQTVEHIKHLKEQRTPTYLAPGAIIYVASNEIPLGLNQTIVTLLKNRLEK